ncbi:MAG: ABC transporter permease subunit [Rikenellaceae bacterium]|nr:ABC transporter permease subunit [Rikenellaceae bacterium]
MKQLRILAFALLSLIGCKEQEDGITNLKMLEGGKTFAVPSGTVADQMVLERFPDAKIAYFNSVMDCALAVKEGKAIATSYDKPVLANIAAKVDGVYVLDELIMDDKYGFAVQKENTSLKQVMDEVLNEIKADGTYEKMSDRWFPKQGEPGPMPDIKLEGQNGVLRFGTSAVTEPMSYVDGSQKVVGFDIEYASYIAKKLGKSLEIVNMEFGAMLPALISGKVDMIGAGLSITEERAKSVLFSESYYPSGIAVMVKRTAEDKEVGKSTGKLRGIEDIGDKRIGVLLGSIHEKYAMENQPDAELLQYPTVSDLLMALKMSKIDAAYFDHVGLKLIIKDNPDVDILAPKVFDVPIAAAFNENKDTLREKFNTFLKEIKASGVYDDMVQRWMEKDIFEMPEIDESDANEELRVGIVCDIGLPFTAVKDGQIVGFDIELSKRFAAYMKMKYVPSDIQFGSMIASIATDKIDMAACSMMITEEREKQVDFSDKYYDCGISILARTDDIAFPGSVPTSKIDKKGFFQSVADSFYNNLILENRYKLIIDGLKLTLLISLLSALLGTILGGFVCYMRMSRKKLLLGFAKGYISLLRGTPVLVLLMIIFYVVFASVNISPVIAAIVAFALNFAAYVSEMFRTSIQGVDKGQTEAGIAGGFTKVETFIYIIMPQAMRQVLPVYKGEFISLLKMTSIVGYIAVQDITRASDIIRSRTFDAFFPLLMAAAIYLVLAWLLTWALDKVEISVDPKRKRIKKAEEAV